MKVTELPFNKLIGLEYSDDSEYLITLNNNIAYTNHIGTVHAAALYALGEATCAQYLAIHFKEEKDEYVPILRKSVVKYKRPAKGIIFGNAVLQNITIKEIKNQLILKGRVLFELHVSLIDQEKNAVMHGEFEWFVSKI